MTPDEIKAKKLLHWDATSQDYLQHRPGYPNDFFVLLQHLDIGLPGQDILDLGVGTGALAIPFAKQGARVTAVDRSEGQIQAGKQAARSQGVQIKFVVSAVESTGLPDHTFDVITASMCWGYFDLNRMEEEVPRLLRPKGLLLVSSLIWIAEEDLIASETEKLIIKHNEAEARTNKAEAVEIIPKWSLKRFRLKSFHEYKTSLPFTRESWRGRIRASKGIGAALTTKQTKAFDSEHEALLERIAPDQFNIRHRIRIQIFEPN